MYYILCLLGYVKRIIFYMITRKQEIWKSQTEGMGNLSKKEVERIYS